MKLLCWIADVLLFGFALNLHKIYVLREICPGVRRLKCSVCGKSWAMSDHHQAVLPWDEEIERIYQMMGYQTW